MRVRIINRDRELDVWWRVWAESLVAAKLRRFAGKITGVVIRTGDLNGPKGGRDKAIQLDVYTECGQINRISEIDQNHEKALYGALSRVKHALARSTSLGARKPIRLVSSPIG